MTDPRRLESSGLEEAQWYLEAGSEVKKEGEGNLDGENGRLVDLCFGAGHDVETDSEWGTLNTRVLCK